MKRTTRIVVYLQIGVLQERWKDGLTCSLDASRSIPGRRIYV